MSNPVASSHFHTQQDILDDLKEKLPVEGLCSPLTNLYAISRINGSHPSFLEGQSREIFNLANNFLKLQYEAFNLYKDGPDYAFKDYEYTSTRFRYPNNPPDEKAFKSMLKKHNLISYPLSSERRPVMHQVYLGFDKDPSTCTLFDANYEGGVKKSSRDQMIHDLFITSSKYISKRNPDSYLKVAATEGIPFRGDVNRSFEEEYKY